MTQNTKDAGASRTDELASMTRMFHAACSDLGLINEALGLDPDDGGAAPILEAIAELKAQIAAPAATTSEVAQAPIMWFASKDPDDDGFVVHKEREAKDCEQDGFDVTPLYTAPVAPTAEQAEAAIAAGGARDDLHEGYRRGLKDAFSLAQGAKLCSRGTPKETCTEIIQTLADLVNGGERAIEVAFSGKPSYPFPARRLNESDESLAVRVDSWHRIAAAPASSTGDQA